MQRTEEMIAGVKSVEQCMICTKCEQAALTASEEQKLLETQLAQMKAQLRAQPLETERLREEQQLQVDSVRLNCHGALSAENEKMVDDFNRLKDLHDRTIRDMSNQHAAQAAEYQKAIDEAISQMNQKAAVLGVAVQQNKELENNVAKLRAENRALANTQQQANISMEIDNAQNTNQPRDDRISFERFGEIMAEHQRRVSETLISLISPLKQHISDTIDARINFHNPTGTTSTNIVLSNCCCFIR